MHELAITVRLPEGLHARPAAEIASLCNHLESATAARYGGPPVDAKSILSLLTLGAKFGETLVFRLDGRDAEHLLERIEHLVSGH